MKSQALQQMISKIHSDKAIRAQFMANPETVMSHYELTEQEKAAVLCTHAKLSVSSGNAVQIETFTYWS